MLSSGARLMGTLLTGGWAVSPPRSLLDTGPLRQTLERHVNLARIRHALLQGDVRGVAVSASSYSTARSITFYDSIEVQKESLKRRFSLRRERWTMVGACVLTLLEVPFRRVVLSSGDTGFGATKTFTGGAPNPTGTPANLFAPNITPDATGIATWTAADVVTLLKTGADKGGKTIYSGTLTPNAYGTCGSVYRLFDLSNNSDPGTGSWTLKVYEDGKAFGNDSARFE